MSPSTRAYAATRKGLFTLDRAGDGSWDVSRAAFLGDHFSLVYVDPRDGAVYGAMELGHFGVKVQRSTDGGKTWEEVGKPTYPEKPEGLSDKDGWGKEVPWNTERIWALTSGGADRPGELWLGTIPGGLFHSRDRGESWEFVESLWNHAGRKKWMGGGADLPGLHSICVDPRDSDRITVGVSCGGVWISTDGGKSWNVGGQGMRADFMPPDQQLDPGIQDPHCVVQSPSDPDVFWTQHHCGIWRSTDNCQSWHEVTAARPSAFGFPVAVHPTDPDTAWFVPAIKDERRYPVDGNVVVSRTRDGGKSFKVLAKGLPQGHAYDLVFRHALDVDRSGERLVFGSTTGSLWVSEDQGDRWLTVSEHLPPIDCVRFA